MKKLLLLSSCLVMGSCFSGATDIPEPAQPNAWTARQDAGIMAVEAQALESWWQHFQDPVLNVLVNTALESSPDRGMAEARVLEARGLRRSSRSSLFPQIGASGSAGRQDTGSPAIGGVDDYYDAGFDASFELDIFGKNRKAFSAADSQLDAAQANYQDVTLSLVAEIARSYIDYRAAQNQYRIAAKNLGSQEQTLKLIQDLQRLGSAPRLDVERASNLVNTTRASLPEFRRQAENARLRLSVLTGMLPEQLAPALAEEGEIPGAQVRPVLMSPVKVLALRPDIRAAAATLAANTALAESATAEFFPAFTLQGFYGVSDSALLSSATVWNVALGAAVSLLDFGRIEGRIDAARAREKLAYEQYRKAVLQAVVDVETALNDYAHINERYVSLLRAYDSAATALDLSQTLYKEGEISFLDVLDAQRNVNQAEASVVSAKAAQSESLVRLFKSLGVV